MSSLNTREDALFKEWKRHLGHASKAFVPDGAICGETFESTWPRIVFLLKEVNDPGGGDWDLRDFLRSAERWQTWNNVTRWTEGILALPEVRPWKDLEHIDRNARIRALRKIAAVNIKKTPGGAAADFEGMRDFARVNREFIRRQLDLYQPNLIVGGGSDVSAVFFEDVYGEPKWCRTMRGTRYAVLGSATYFDYYHPGARMPKKLLFDELIDSVRERAGAWTEHAANRPGGRQSRRQPR